MSAVILNINVEQGSTFSQSVTLTGFDLYEYTLSCQIRSVANAMSPVLVTPTVDYTHIGATDPIVPIRTFTISMTATQTKALVSVGKNYSVPTQFAYDVIGTKIDGTVTRFVNGIVYVSPAVTV
jgi:hypothetical protein